MGCRLGSGLQKLIADLGISALSFSDDGTFFRVPLAPCCEPGDVEARCGLGDVEVFASRAPELWRCDAGEGTSRYVDLVACCGCRDV